MVEAGLDLKQPGMNKDNFQHGYNFAEAFQQDG
jgi:hypothetical protein